MPKQTMFQARISEIGWMVINNKILGDKLIKTIVENRTLLAQGKKVIIEGESLSVAETTQSLTP